MSSVAVSRQPMGLLRTSCGTPCGSRLAKTICYRTANDHFPPLSCVYVLGWQAAAIRMLSSAGVFANTKQLRR
jgi:hypothetical protein